MSSDHKAQKQKNLSEGKSMKTCNVHSIPSCTLSKKNNVACHLRGLSPMVISIFQNSWSSLDKKKFQRRSIRQSRLQKFPSTHKSMKTKLPGSKRLLQKKFPSNNKNIQKIKKIENIFSQSQISSMKIFPNDLKLKSGSEKYDIIRMDLQGNKNAKKPSHFINYSSSGICQPIHGVQSWSLGFFVSEPLPL